MPRLALTSAGIFWVDLWEALQQKDLQCKALQYSCASKCNNHNERCGERYRCDCVGPCQEEAWSNQAYVDAKVSRDTFIEVATRSRASVARRPAGLPPQQPRPRPRLGSERLPNIINLERTDACALPRPKFNSDGRAAEATNKDSIDRRLLQMESAVISSLDC